MLSQFWRGRRGLRRCWPALAVVVVGMTLAASAAGADVYLAGCAGLMCQGFTCTSLVLDYKYECVFLDTVFGCACGAPQLAGVADGDDDDGAAAADAVECGLCRWQNYTRDICWDDESFRGS
jgi:hypothetical protein